MDMAKSNSLRAHQIDVIGKSLIFLLCVIGVLQLIMAFRFEVNQDEFYSLNMIYEFARGEVKTPFQTVFLRLFGWLQHIPGQEVDQIVAGRLVLMLCGLMTAWLIFKISRRFSSLNASLFAVLGYFSFFFVFRHLTAFRVDGVITVFLMGALYLASDPEPNWKKICMAGVLIGAACMITLKSIFYLPIIAAFLLGRWISSGWRLREFLQGLVMAGVSVLAFGAIYVWHNQMGASGEVDLAFLQDISGTSFFAGGFLNRGNAIAISLIFNPIGWVLILVGLLAVLLGFFKPGKRDGKASLALIFFIVPLTTIFYYFHANPYYYIFIMAPAAVFIAIAADRFIIAKRTPLFVILIAILSLMITRAFVQSLPQNQKDQRAVIAAAHSIFPDPVNVIDYCGMMSSFNRINETGWFINPDIFAMEKYYKSGPILQTVLPKYQPKLVIANVNALDLADAYEHQFDAPILDRDTDMLREHYVNFWGPLYIPGKTLINEDDFTILIPGDYTVKSNTEISVDGKTYGYGDILTLSDGTHQVSLLDNQKAQLVWGRNLKKPTIAEPTHSLFNGF